MVRHTTRPLLILLTAMMLIGLTLAPTTVADHEYEQPVWLNWHTMQLNVLVTGVDDPIVGDAIMDAIDSWETGIQELAPAWLADEFELRVHFPARDPVPPDGWVPWLIHIYVAPQGFFAVNPPGSHCLAFAPMMAGWGSHYHVALHEFGHCLGLGHVFNHGSEYSPTFDPMGSGQSGFRSCPSNLNMQVLERVFSGQSGTVTMSASAYHQADC